MAMNKMVVRSVFSFVLVGSCVSVFGKNNVARNKSGAKRTYKLVSEKTGAVKNFYLVSDAPVNLEMADAGDLESMSYCAFTALERAEKTGNIKYVKEGLMWLYRFSIRVIQDAACCNDKSVGAVGEERLLIFSFKLYELAKSGVLKQEDVNKIDEVKIRNEAMQWVRSLTVQGTLVEPYGIAHYGMKLIQPALKGKREFDLNPLFIKKKQWKAVRLRVISALTQKIKKGKEE